MRREIPWGSDDTEEDVKDNDVARSNALAAQPVFDSDEVASPDVFFSFRRLDILELKMTEVSLAMDTSMVTWLPQRLMHTCLIIRPTASHDAMGSDDDECGDDGII